MGVVLDESRGPRPLEREMTDATVAISVVVVVVVVVIRGLLGMLSIGSGHDRGRVETDAGKADDRPLRDGNVPSIVEVGTLPPGLLFGMLSIGSGHDRGSVDKIPGVAPPRMDTTTGGVSVAGKAGTAGVAVSIDSGLIPLVLSPGRKGWRALTGKTEGIREGDEDKAQSQAVKTVCVR